MATYVARRCQSCQEVQVIPERESLQMQTVCKKCGKIDWQQPPAISRNHPGIIIPDSKWSSENGGKGHYCTFLEANQSGKRSEYAYVQSAGEMKRKLAEHGMRATRDGF